MLVYRRLERLADAEDTILDLGSKDGQYLETVPGTIIGVDIQFEFPVDMESASYMYADGRQLPFESDSFDYVVLNQVVEHVREKYALVAEVSRVLVPGGVAFIAFPNRFTLNKPHGLPRWLSFLPKVIGAQVGTVFLDQDEMEYYLNGVFPLSPIGARRILSEYFRNVDYITIDESKQSPDIYSEALLAQLFVSSVPLLNTLFCFPPFAWGFEAIWGYVGYACSAPVER